MRKLLIRGGHVVDPATATDVHGLDVLLAEGKVLRLGRRLAAGDARVIDAEGLVVCPGFIDMHVHLREPGHEEAETVASGVAAAVAGGFTAVASMANTDPVNDDPAVTELVLTLARRADLARVWPIAAVTKGLRGEELSEFGLLKQAGAVALSDDGRPIASSEVMRRALEYADQLGMLVIEHCEDPHLSSGWSMNEGAASTRLGLRGLSPAGEEILLVRDAVLARATGARVHAAHLSTAGSVERLREEKARGVRVSGEVTPHHFILTDDAVGGYDTNAKMAPPLRGAADVAALIEGLRDGTIDCIATDHAPHHRDKKEVEFERAANGIVGLETAVALVLDRLLHRQIIDLKRLIELMSVNPARLLGVPGGTLAEGASADLTLLDLERVAEVDPASFRSRSRNTPFAGLKLRGWPAATVVGGRVRWSRDASWMDESA